MQLSPCLNYSIAFKYYRYLKNHLPFSLNSNPFFSTRHKSSSFPRHTNGFDFIITFYLLSFLSNKLPPKDFLIYGCLIANTVPNGNYSQSCSNDYCEST